jgi:cell wall-associated NlpC family hydrolase
MLFGVVVTALAAVGSALPDSITQKQAEARQTLQRIDSLGHRLDLATEAYDGATQKLDRIKASLRVNEHELAVARHDYRIGVDRLGARLRQIYMEGEPDPTLEVLLGARSVDDVINALDGEQQVSRQDADLVKRIERYKAQVIHEHAVLARARKAQARVVAERAAERAQIEHGLAQQRRLLSSIRSEIAYLRRQEQIRQAELAAEAQARLAAEHNAEQQALAAAVIGATLTGPSGANGFPGSAVVPASAIGTRVVQIAMQYLGDPYVWGAEGPTTFDCSGLVTYVFAQVGISLPHYAASQWNYGVYVPRGELEPGDLVFFENLGHVGIYVGNGDYIQAPQPGDVVKITPLSEPWSAANYFGAKRIA